MKRKNLRAELMPGNEAAYLGATDHKQIVADYGVLLLLIAQAMDDAAVGNDTWLAIGKTKDRTSFALTVHLDEGPQSVYAANLVDLSAAAADLI